MTSYDVKKLSHYSHLNPGPQPSNFVQHWLIHLGRSGKSRHTIAAYRRALEHFIRWHGENYRIDPFDPAKITPHHLYKWKVYQQTAEKARPATINLRLVALSRFFSWATANNLLPVDPTDDLSDLRLSLRPRQLKSLNEDELNQFLRFVHADENQRDIAIVELMVGTGLRTSELLKLRLGDIQIEQEMGHTIANQPEMWEIGPQAHRGQLMIRGGKRSGYRTVTIPPEAIKAILAYLQIYANTKPPVKAVDAEDPLWLGKRGPLTYGTSIRRILDKYARQADLKPFGPHTLRHTFAIRYLEANPDDSRGLAATLGHETMKSVKRYEEAVNS